MTHTHTTNTSRNILGDTLSECKCGARKYSSGHAILGGVLDTEGWYVAAEPTETPEEKARAHAYEMLQTEGYGYGKDASDLLDSHTPNID